MTVAVLEAARLRVDAPADALVARLGGHAWAVLALLRAIRRNDEPLPETLPIEVAEFMNAVAPPPWLDRVRVVRAQRWAEEHLLPITAALFCASLPSAYAAERGARVLAATGRLGADIDGRVNETARFVLDLLAPGALDPSGAGIRAAQRTRLVHAAVRRSLAGQLAGEVAVNQEDLLGTLLTFSVVVIRAVRRLGVAADARAADDYFHLWRGVGVMLGLEESLLPSDFTAAATLTDLLAERHFRPSGHGRALMAALLARMEDHVPAFRTSPRCLVRYLVGDVVADLLAVPPGKGWLAPTGWPGGVPYVGRPVEALLARAATRLARPALEAVVANKLRSGRML